MKTKLLSLTAVLFTLALTAFVAPGFKTDTFKVDVQKSALTWVGKKVTGSHNGTINIQSGILQFNGKKLSGGNFVIDMTTIKDSDKSARLEGHLKSDDFFGSDKFATSEFTIKKVAPGAGSKLTITGDLKIKGITHPITFPATLVWNADGSVTATAEKIIVDRTKYDIKYRSEGIMDIGDKLIYNNFELSVKLIARK
jgi:polyisoprenoid-binding protein YceI